MSTLRYVGKAAFVKQQITITPVAANSATYNVDIGVQRLTYTADSSATVAEITAGLVALLSSTDAPLEYQDITWTDETTHVLGVAKTAGTPFTVSSSSSAGSLTTATTVASSSPYDISLTDNWSGGALPVNGDTVYVDGFNWYWGLASLTGVTLAEINFNLGTGEVGLPVINSAGYVEYRQRYLLVGATLAYVGRGSGSTINKLYWDQENVASTINVELSTNLDRDGLPSVMLTNTNASTVLRLIRGSASVCYYGGETGSISSVYMEDDSSNAVILGDGCTLGSTFIQKNGISKINEGPTTLTIYDGECELNKTAAVTTMNIFGGVVTDKGSGTIGTVNLTGELNLPSNGPTKTITDMNLNVGAVFIDENRRATLTNPPVLDANCGLEDVTIRRGKGITVTV